jgi:hypothetical protein
MNRLNPQGKVPPPDTSSSTANENESLPEELRRPLAPLFDTAGWWMDEQAKTALVKGPMDLLKLMSRIAELEHYWPRMTPFNKCAITVRIMGGEMYNRLGYVPMTWLMGTVAHVQDVLCGKDQDVGDRMSQQISLFRVLYDLGYIEVLDIKKCRIAISEIEYNDTAKAKFAQISKLQAEAVFGGRTFDDMVKAAVEDEGKVMGNPDLAKDIETFMEMAFPTAKGDMMGMV